MMDALYFLELMPNEEQRNRYKGETAKLADLVVSAVAQLIESSRVTERATFKPGSNEDYHVTYLSLIRHICEWLDGVAVLVRQGCTPPCSTLLRSALEANLGVLFILKDDTERRARAYQLAHAHTRIKQYKSFDSNEQAGKQTLAMMEKDKIAKGMKLPTFDYPKLVANLEGMLAKPEFVGIEVEWQRLKAKHKNKDPAWYSLFDGPMNALGLAKCVDMESAYHFLYRLWSGSVHAGDCLLNFTASKSEPGSTSIRPLRHPEGLQGMAVMACNFALSLSYELQMRFGTEQDKQRFGDAYKVISAELNRLKTNRPLDIPWK